MKAEMEAEMNRKWNGNELEMDRREPGNGSGNGPESNQKWTGHESVVEAEMKRKWTGIEPEMDRK